MRSATRRSSTRNSSTTSTSSSTASSSRRISARGWRISSSRRLKLSDGSPSPNSSTSRLAPQTEDGRRQQINKNDTHERIMFSARFACPVSGFTIDEIEPRLFSFNAPAGACPTCDGLGTGTALRARTRRARANAQLDEGRHLSLGQDRRLLALLRADARESRQALQGVDEDAVGAAAQARAARDPVRLGR